MNQKDKDLLLKDLSARLPHHCRVFYEYVDDLDNKTYGYSVTLNTWCINELDSNKAVVKPYLRPMSSMTEEEKREYNSFIKGQHPFDSDFSAYPIEHKFVYEFDTKNYIDWMNKHHFDYRGLIEKGLALEALEGMYD